MGGAPFGFPCFSAVPSGLRRKKIIIQRQWFLSSVWRSDYWSREWEGKGAEFSRFSSSESRPSSFSVRHLATGSGLYKCKSIKLATKLRLLSKKKKKKERERERPALEEQPADSLSSFRVEAPVRPPFLPEELIRPLCSAVFNPTQFRARRIIYARARARTPSPANTNTNTRGNLGPNRLFNSCFSFAPSRPPGEIYGTRQPIFSFFLFFLSPRLGFKFKLELVRTREFELSSTFSEFSDVLFLFPLSFRWSKAGKAL